MKEQSRVRPLHGDRAERPLHTKDEKMNENQIEWRWQGAAGRLGQLKSKWLAMLDDQLRHIARSAGRLIRPISGPTEQDQEHAAEDSTPV